MSTVPRFFHPSSDELYSYWNARRGGRQAPFRSEIEPSDIRNLLADIFILDVDAKDQYSWRLAGTRVCMIHCRELKGRDFMSDWTGQNEETMRTLLRTVVDKNLVAVIEIEGRNHRNQKVEMEMTLMPLHVEESDELRILGCIVPLDQPYWLGIYPPANREIKTSRMIWPSTPLRDPYPPVQKRSFAADNNRTATLHFAHFPNSRRVRHLMVLDGGKRT